MFDQRARAGLVAVILAALLATAVAAPAVGSSPTRAKKAEWYALSLLNCTRTGGWVTAAGRCRGRGSGKYSAKRAPLQRSMGLSHKVAWPWARKLTIAKDCAHELVGEPLLGGRFSSKGYRHYVIGENIGCGWGGRPAKQIVLATHRDMQAEKSYGGGHWRNMKDPDYKSVGIGVANSNGRTTVVYDFYGKRPK
jgi:hypothetical protein